MYCFLNCCSEVDIFQEDGEALLSDPLPLDDTPPQLADETGYVLQECELTFSESFPFVKEAQSIPSLTQPAFSAQDSLFHLPALSKGTQFNLHY